MKYDVFKRAQRMYRMYLSRLLMAFLAASLFFAGPGCKKDSDDTLFPAALYLLLTSNNVGLSGAVGTIAGIGQTLSKNTRLSAADITDIVAYGIDGSVVLGTVNANGSFALTLQKQKSYIIIFVSGTSVIGSYRLDSLGLDSIPTQSAVADISVGTVDFANNEGKSTTATFTQEQFLAAVGGTSTNVAAAGTADDNLLMYRNVDLDQNGIIDVKETGKRVNMSIQYEWTKTVTVNNVSGAQNQFTNLADIISDANRQTHILYFTLPDVLNPADQVTVSFPSMTAGSNVTTTADNATSVLVNKTTNDTANGYVPTGDGTGFTGIQYFVSLPAKTIGGGVDNNLQPGTYSITSGGTTYTFKNLKPRVVSNSIGLHFMTIRLNTDSSGVITSIDYKWQKSTASGFVDSTLEELAFIYKSSPYNANIQCREKASPGNIKLACTPSYDTVSGSYTDPASCYTSFANVNVNDLKICEVFSKDAYGTTIKYNLGSF